MHFVILPRKLLAWDMIMWYLGEQVLITPMHVRSDFLQSVIKEKKKEEKNRMWCWMSKVEIRLAMIVT